MIDEAAEKFTAATASIASTREVLDKARAKVVQPAKVQSGSIIIFGIFSVWNSSSAAVIFGAKWSSGPG